MLCEHDKCTGCGACAAVCPVGAISLREDENGFRAPVVCRQTCIDCGRCTASCPVLNPPVQKGRIDPTAWAFRLKDEKTLHRSASGGAFAMLAREIFQRKGTVWGAVWNQEHDVVYACAETEEQLTPLHGSKYVQSDASGAYAEIKKQLREGRTVLFTGVPCQVAGLYGFLGTCDHPNLYTAEIVCHGGGSPRMLRDHITNIGEQQNSPVVRIDHTSKCRPWSILIQKTICMGLQNGEQIVRDSSEDAYLSLFLNGVVYRDSCYTCPFASLPRIADITLGDFFGFGVPVRHRFKTQGGISQIVVNTGRGQALFDEACAKYGMRQQCRMEECMIFNHNLWRPSPRHALRDEVFDTYRKEGFKAVEQKYYQAASNRNNRWGRKVIKKILGPEGTALGMYLTYRAQGLGRQIRVVLAQVNKGEGK